MTKETESPAKITESSTQLIYADRIISFAPGSAVSKLTLGMEAGQKVFKPTVTLVIPTASLLESISFIQNTLRENEALKDELKKGVDELKERYEKI